MIISMIVARTVFPRSGLPISIIIRCAGLPGRSRFPAHFRKSRLSSWDMAWSKECLELRTLGVRIVVYRDDVAGEVGRAEVEALDFTVGMDPEHTVLGVEHPVVFVEDALVPRRTTSEVADKGI